MSGDHLTRRDFHKLSLAALGGAVSGAMLAGCSQEPDGGAGVADLDPHAGHDHGPSESHAAAVSEDPSPFLSDPNVCRGLNVCKGYGQGGANDFAGMSNCHTATKHSCHAHNDCKGQGGCGETAGMNSCKGQGKCAVPLKEETWKKALAKFEAAMKTASKPFGDPPA